ncbi:hypothetical protein OPIT5_29905 [Opitutaceae bacterium TAV5]|nr:hypothetical protein OPIT5_29905 [Opitutaceae bacterium TAV5]
MKSRTLPWWIAPVIMLVGIPSTYAAIFYSRIGINLAYGQREILEEKSLGATVLIWMAIFAGVVTVRLLTKRIEKNEN